jgi:hypothetical protein
MTPMGTVVAGTDRRRARLSSVSPHTSLSTHRNEASIHIVHTAATATPHHHVQSVVEHPQPAQT